MRLPAPRSSLPVDPVRDGDAPAAAFVPCLEVVGASFVFDEGGGSVADYREVEHLALRLSFAYGEVVVSAGDPRPAVFVAGEGGLRAMQRDLPGETRARRRLETLGPLDLEALDDLVLVPGQRADYVVDPDADPDTLCDFATRVVPTLEGEGWRVRFALDCPFRLVDSASWYSRLGEVDEARGWFEVELGVEVEGGRVDLLPVLLELLTGDASRIERLLRAGRPYMAIPIGGGRHVAVAPERIRRAMTVLRELHEIDGPPPRGCRIPAIAPYYLGELETSLAIDHGRERGPVRTTLERLSAATEPTDAELASPRRLAATLRPYQRAGLAWLQRLAARGASGLLADDMGLGKTLQTIAHICAEQQAGRLDRPALIVTLTSLVGNWQRELRRFAPHLEAVVAHGPKRRVVDPLIRRAQVVVTSYPVLIRDLDVYSRETFHLMVLDEAQAIKNASSQVHEAVISVRARLRLCLTGTPIENNLEELRALFEFLDPRLLGDARRFRTRFRLPIEQLGSAERLASLRKRVAPFLLRRRKAEVAAELPAKSEIVRSVEIEGAQRDLYESIRVAAHATIRAVIREKGLAASTVAVLGALTKLRQVCCDPRLIALDGAGDRAGAGDGQATPIGSAKLELLMEMLPTLVDQGRRVLVFSQFTSMLALISASLHARGLAHLTLTGASQDRQQLVDRFEAGATDVFLISLKAGGAGLNLTSADTVIHYDPWWNPATREQATDRAHRIGQTRPVFVYQLIVAGSIEERMLELHERKRKLADGILAGEIGSALDQRSIDALVAPLLR